jgi:hypothetical protein
VGLSQRRAHQTTHLAQQPTARVAAASLGVARNSHRPSYCASQHLIVDAVKVGLRNAYDIDPCTTALANAKGVDFSALVNDLLKKDIELIELGR